jgi:uncharacterized YccA/Bax inhibitor family protein
MTIAGTVNKTLALLLTTIVVASYTWGKALSWDPASAIPWMMAGLFGGFIVALVTIFRPQAARWSAPLYAVCEGLFLGGISAVFEQSYPGIAFQAVTLTFGTLMALLLAYKSRLIQPTAKFRLGVMAATGGIALFYFIALILNLFGVDVALIHQGGTYGILFSLFVVIIAALNLVLDFGFVEEGVAAHAPKYLEWYAAFGLLVTLVWLYLEILRLLSKLRSRR